MNCSKGYVSIVREWCARECVVCSRNVNQHSDLDPWFQVLVSGASVLGSMPGISKCTRALWSVLCVHGLCCQDPGYNVRDVELGCGVDLSNGLAFWGGGVRAKYPACGAWCGTPVTKSRV